MQDPLVLSTLHRSSLGLTLHTSRAKLNKAIQQAFYDAQGELVLPCNLATVFPIGAYVKVDFKLGALKRTDGQNPLMQTRLWYVPIQQL
jgi:hypothetical protein